jgi:hypothetical protein
MSLVGSLEDLGLGEILQIVSLSGKSGVLWIRSRMGEGRIVFSRGLIRGAFVKDGPGDLHELVAAAGAVPTAELEPLAAEARSAGAPLEALLCARTALDAAAIDALREKHVETTVLRMFGWPTGEFSFEIRDDPAEGETEELLLRGGLNAQFLALEGTRLSDEDDHDGSSPSAAGEDPFGDPDASQESRSDAPDADGARGTEVGPGGIEGALDAEAEPLGPDGPAELQITVLELTDEEELPSVLSDPESAEGPIVDDEPTLTAANRVSPGAAPELRAREVPLSRPAAPAPAAAARRPDRAPPAPLRAASEPRPVVVIDRELAALEWVKRALASLPVRVHIFQRSEQGITRIRQYVARGELPLVVLTTATPPDAVSGARDWSEIAARLRAQVPTLPLVLLTAAGAPVSPVSERAIPDALSPRPDLTTLSDDRARSRRETLAGELRGALERAHAKSAPRGGPASPRDDSADALRSLRDVSARLRDPSSRGEVLRLVLEFAARSFDRVAIFAVREGEVQGVAQAGLTAAGGPDDEDLRRMRLPADEPGWFRKVLASRSPLRAAPEDAGDRDLAARLGRSAAREVYVAPIESGDRIAAILYADNLPSQRALPDTSALEVVVHEAGLALERTVLERALEAAEGERAEAAPSDPERF